MLWTYKYSPLGLEDFAGNPTAILSIRKWLSSWKPGSRPLLLVGGAGVGKTTAAHVLAQSNNLEVLEMNSSDLRNQKNIEKIAGVASVTTTLTGKKRLILFDEIDAMFRTDYRGMSAVTKVLRETKCPIVLTATDPYIPSLTGIRFSSEMVKFKKVHYSTITKVLVEICKQEGIECEKEVLLELAKLEDGDLKAAINDLQAIAIGKSTLFKEDLELVAERDRKNNIFNALRTLFKAESFEEAKKSFDMVDDTPDFFLKWVEENIPREYSQAGDRARAFHWLARADMFGSRIIRRQNWKLLKYEIALMTSGVSMAKENTYTGFTPYQFPSLIKSLSASKKNRRIRKSISGKIASIIHTSKKEISGSSWPFLYLMFLDKPEQFSALFGLEAEEIEFLGADKPKEVFKAAKELKVKEISSIL